MNIDKYFRQIEINFYDFFMTLWWGMSRLSIILVFIGITLTAQIFAYFWWFPQDRYPKKCSEIIFKIYLRLIHTHSLCVYFFLTFVESQIIVFQILIPFRDRDKELNIMVPKLNEFLKRQKIGIFHFLILNQVLDLYFFCLITILTSFR